MARLEPGKEFAASQVRSEAAWNPGGVGSEDKSHGQAQNYLGRRSSSKGKTSLIILPDKAL